MFADGVGAFAQFSPCAAAQTGVGFHEAETEIDIMLDEPQAVLTGWLVHKITSHIIVKYSLHQM